MSNPYRENYSNKGQTQVSARVADDLKDDIEQLADDRGITQNELICNSLTETVADAGMIDDGSDIEPEDPTARDLYRSMLGRMEPGSEAGLTPIKSLLSQDTQIPAGQIPMWIRRMAKKGYAHIRASCPGKSVNRYAVAVKPPHAEPGKWSPYDDDRRADPDEVTNAEEELEEIDGEPITTGDPDPVDAAAGIDTTDNHVLSMDTFVDSDPEPDADTEEGTEEIVSDGGIRLVDYYRGIYQLENGQPVAVDAIDLFPEKIQEIEDQGWLKTEDGLIYCQVIPQDKVTIEDGNFDTLGDKKREHFKRAGYCYDSYLRTEKNLTPDPTRLVIDQTTNDTTKEETAA